MADFAPLPDPLNAHGRPRLTGVEIEIGGLEEADCARVCARYLNGRAVQTDAVIWTVEQSTLGRVQIYLDTALRKFGESALRDAALSLGREVIPVEIVTEPLDRDGLQRLDGLRDELRKAGAIGSGGGIFFGFGVHLNVEISSWDSAGVVPPLLAYALIEDWLRALDPIDNMRRLLPFADPYPTSLVRALITLGPDARLTDVIDAYFLATTSRNHALDMLPVFAHLDRPRVREVLTEASSARPAFHFRLPDCRIDEPEWTLAREWHRWLLVERVARDRVLLEKLSARWLEEHGVVTLSRTAWAAAAGEILSRHGIPGTGR